MDALLVGVDAGGTATRCLVSTVDGNVLARSDAGGANQNSSAGRPVDALTTALRGALSDLDRSTVVGGIVAAAGSSGAGRARARAAAADAWRAAGLTGPVEVVTDLEAAFAAGTATSAGVLLLAGTGAVAARFEDHRLVRRCDGYGWLAGDEGSAVWVGREALRAVLAALDGRGAATLLTASVTQLLAGNCPTDDVEAQAQALVAAGFAGPPAALGRLAPLVGAAATAGDPVAAGIVADAVARLLHALETVAGGPAPGAVVLAGGLLLADGPVGDAVRAGVRDRFDAEPRDAADGAAGAAALAIARCTGRSVTDEVHRRLTGVRHRTRSSGGR